MSVSTKKDSLKDKEYMPFVSIVIAAYNAETTIDACLTSIYNSAYKNYEVILANDGSRDNTVSLAEKFSCRVLELGKSKGIFYAKDYGAKRARGDIIFFIDSDMVVYDDDTLQKVANIFIEHPDIAAVSGSYTKAIPSNDFFSRYRNFRHHYLHQTSSSQTNSFFDGFGAIRTGVYKEIGGFKLLGYMGGIELGYRLRQCGYKILLKKDIQGIHLGKYNFLKLVKTELFNRAIPWTMIMLKNKKCHLDLNIKLAGIISVSFVYLFLILIIGSIFYPWLFVFSLMSIVGVILLNLDFFKFILKETSWRFLVATFFMHILYYFYCGIGLILGIIRFLAKRTEEYKVMAQRVILDDKI